jgi:protein-tyrosine phosphatase
LLALLVTAFIVIRIAIRLGGRKVSAFDASAWIIPPEVEAEVVRLPDGDPVIRWEVDADQVDIYASVDPDDFGTAERLEYVMGVKEVILRGLGGRRRHYFRLEFKGGERDGGALFVAERFLPLSSVNNLRDIGGYQTSDGRYVKWGKVFRTGNLVHLNDEDMGYLADVGINLVCDMRSTVKIEGSPDRLPPGADYLHTAIYEDEFSREIFPLMLFRRHELGEALARGYRNWPDTGAHAYGRFFESLADPANLPAMFHCTAGKDRVGIAAAILLSLLGVPDETIIADYSLSNWVFDDLYGEFVEADQVGRLGIPNEDVKIMLSANPEWIKRTLSFVHTQYGDAATYLRRAAGLSQSTIDAIRENLLMG